MTVDSLTILDWLETLWPDPPDGWLTLFARDQPTRWHPINQIDDAADTAADIAAGRDVWFGVGLRREQLPTGRGGDRDVLAIPGLWVDVDVAGPGHKTTHELPDSIDDARQLLADLPVPPTALVATGGGVHGWWLTHEPIDAEVAAPLLARWGATWKELASRRGWHVDDVFDLARIMRLPGTLNHKTGEPRPVELLELHPDRRYTVDELDEWLQDPPAPTPAPSSTSTSTASGDRPGDRFNAETTGDEVLERAGWTLHHTDRAGDRHWTRPGKTKREGHSATVYADNGRTTVFTDAVPQLPPDTYDPWGLHVHLHHAGDFTAAASAYRHEHGPPAPNHHVKDASDPKNKDIDEANQTTGIENEHPVVVVNGRRLHTITREILGHLHAANDPPWLYIRSGTLTRVHYDENQRPKLEVVDLHRLRHRVARVADTVRANKDGTHVRIATPLDVVNDILVTNDVPFPPLEGVVEIPTLRPDGTVNNTLGYDPATRLLRAPGLATPDIPNEPTPDDTAGALKLLEELVTDFPFDTTADRANALGLLLTPVIRPAINGQVPLALVDAPEPGTGKGLLANVVAIVATGRAAAARPLSSTDEEVRKMLTAVLLEGPAVVVLDNVEDAIRAPSLAAVLTTDEWTDRLLGRSETVAVPNRATWVATGNNLNVAGDIARRCYRVRLDAHQARPYTRTEFRHDDLLGWTKQHRGELVAALLTLARAWWHAGQPPAPDLPTIGGFTPWARTVGGILHHAGITGFLDNLAAFHDDVDVETGAWETFLTAVLEQWPEQRFTVAELVNEIESEYGHLRHVLPAELVDWVHKPGLSKRLGGALRRRDGRRHGDSELVVTKVGHTRTKVAQYLVTAMKDPAPETDHDASNDAPRATADDAAEDF